MKKQWLYFLLVFLLPVIGIFWWWGAFATVTVETAQRGPYHYAYLEFTEDYAKLPDNQQEVIHEFQLQNITRGAAINLLLDDPRTTPRKEQTARIGYLIEPGVMVRAPLKLGDVPARTVLMARVRAHPRLAPGKVYAALLQYLKEHGMKFNLPTVEIYQNSEMTVEMAV